MAEGAEKAEKAEKEEVGWGKAIAAGAAFALGAAIVNGLLRWGGHAIRQRRGHEDPEISWEDL